MVGFTAPIFMKLPNTQQHYVHVTYTELNPNQKINVEYIDTYFFQRRCGPTGAMTSSFLRFLDHTQRRITVGRTPPDERSVSRRDLYLTTHNTHNKHLCLRWDSNPRSQQASGRRPTPQTTRQVWSIRIEIYLLP